ncbi:hypothetical protein KKC13_12230 [bacterium]|nr:hypothetical protein [bacterium]MBU1958727.1 hypothetical protein [bacterium]
MSLKKSLKPIRKKIVQNNNVFKTIRRVYTHLSELSNDEILNYYHVVSIKELHAHIEHIKTIILEKTENYKDELEAIDRCFCTDSHGNFKDLYFTQKETQQKINLLYKEQRIKLKLYPCPYDCGWHLTKE